MKKYASKRFIPILTAALLGSSVSSSVYPQEGYPLDGVWRGQWGSEGNMNSVIVLLEWNGETIEGVINPGRAASPILQASLDASDWTVRIEAQRQGQPLLVEGQLERIGHYDREVVGSWTLDGETYPFRMVRE